MEWVGRRRRESRRARGHSMQLKIFGRRCREERKMRAKEQIRAWDASGPPLSRPLAANRRLRQANIDAQMRLCEIHLISLALSTSYPVFSIYRLSRSRCA